MITLGTGLGSGIYANNRLIYGYDGFAGEMGHIVVENDGRVGVIVEIKVVLNLMFLQWYQ